MKSSIFFALFVVCLVAHTAGATEVGPGPVSGDWDAAGNPYNINGEIFVPVGETLTIHEGVEVIFQGHYKLIINGHLEAVGTKVSPVLFTAVNTVEGWNGIRIIDAPDASQLIWCIIEYGRAFGKSYLDPDGWGGGVLCYNSSPVISNCEFRENSATVGGGITCYSSTSELTQCDITGNYAELLAGGAFFYLSDSTMRDCDTSVNISDDSGGAVYVWDCSVTIEDCNISGNHCARWGGGIGAGLPADITVRNSTITGNTSARWAGGIACDTTTMTITDNVISGNSALEESSGGIHTYRDCTGTISGNIIAGNQAVTGGGGIAIWRSCSLVMTNNLVINNTVTGVNGNGAGIICCDNSTATIRNMTICGNSAATNGGGISCEEGSSVTISNTILWDNEAGTSAEEIFIGSTANPSTVTIDYSDVRGGQDYILVHPNNTLNWGSGMMDEDPLFVTGPDGEYFLSQDPCQPGIVNPCVDTGDPASEMIRGTTRTDQIQDADVVDMGYHYPLLGTVTADLACTPESGVLPFAVQFNVMMGNTADISRSIAGRIDVSIAGGASYQNWRSGYTNVEPGETFAISWTKTVPALPSLVGPNVFDFHVQDVTPPPWNQPPYPPSGDTATAGCTVTGNAR